MFLCVEQPTFHADTEGVRDRAVVVEGSTLILSVISVTDAVEAEPAATAFHVATGFTKDAILLLPLHPWGGSTDTQK